MENIGKLIRCIFFGWGGGGGCFYFSNGARTRLDVTLCYIECEAFKFKRW